MTLIVAAIVLALAVPSFTDIIKNNRLITQANELVTALNIARSEAIKRSVNIDVASTNNSSDWSGGWTVEINGGATLRSFDALTGNAILTSTGGLSNFQYNSAGFIDNSDTLQLCDDRTGETGKQIIIFAGWPFRYPCFHFL